LKQIFALPVLLMLLCPVSAHADTGITGPSFTAGYDRIHIPAFQLSINDEPPFACSPDTRGGIALDSKAHLCLCDGSWKLANTDEACAWKSAGK